MNTARLSLFSREREQHGQSYRGMKEGGGLLMITAHCGCCASVERGAVMVEDAGRLKLGLRRNMRGP